MEGIRLNSNIASLQAQRRLGQSSDLVARSMERLASGLRCASVLLGNPSQVSSIARLNLLSQADARAALPILRAQLDRITSELGNIGSYQSRLEVTARVPSVTRENYVAAAARIEDADVAEAAAEMVRSSIVQQAAASVLAQANQQPALALTLLR